MTLNISREIDDEAAPADLKRMVNNDGSIHGLHKLSAVLKVTQVEHQWLARVRLRSELSNFEAQANQGNNSNAEDRKFTPKDSDFDLIHAVEQLDICGDEPYVWQVCWDGCLDNTAAYVRFTPRSFEADRLESWAWPYLSPHPRVLHVMCTAGSNLTFFIGGLPRPVSDVLEWLRFDSECCALAYEDHQHLCLAISLQASAFLLPHPRPPCRPFQVRSRRCRLPPAGGRWRRACSTCTARASSTST
jgi:hypothetical protein